MSTKRIPDRAGFVGAVTACRWCGKPKPWEDKYRRTFCSDECVEQHKIRTQPDHAAKRVLERDHGICCACGLDTIALFDELNRRLLEAIMSTMRGPFRCSEPWPKTYYCDHETCRAYQAQCVKRDDLHCHGDRHRAEQHPDFVQWCDLQKFPMHLRRAKRRLWELDHITPVVEGGADCGLDNLRTLCWSCHKQETAALAGRRAARRAK